MADDQSQSDSQAGAPGSPGGEEDAPPLAPPSFPQRRKAQQRRLGAPRTTLPLVTPPPGGLQKSPEELTRLIGWMALTEAVASSAQALYPDDPMAVALNVANTLQPYMIPFAPLGRQLGFEGTPGMIGAASAGTPLSNATNHTKLPNTNIPSQPSQEMSVGTTLISGRSIGKASTVSRR